MNAETTTGQPPLWSERSSNGAETSLDLFLRGFTASALAEPLASFDDSTSLPQLQTALRAYAYSVVGIRRSGFVARWLSADDIAGGLAPAQARLFDPATVISQTFPLHEVVHRLNASPFLFVRTFGDVTGVIHRRDIEKPPMRMWLFGLVTITELRITRMIAACCPNESWREFLSEGRLQVAHTLQEERRRRGGDPSLLDCLQFGDKGQIVAKHEALREITQFPSRRAVESFVQELQSLRNNLAHAQDIAGDWEVICKLALNLQRIVLGPPAGNAIPPAAAHLQHSGEIQ